MKPKLGVCKLCQRESMLQNSHIVPRLVYKRMRRSSRVGGLLDLKNPHNFIQDGMKAHLLCYDCEQRFNRYESEFAAKILDPYLEKGVWKFEYGEWGLRLGVSIVWRALVRFLELKGHALPSDQLRQAKRAEIRWRLFLLGKRGNVGTFSIHAVMLEDVTNLDVASVRNASSYARQHAASVTTCNIVRLRSDFFVYVKMMQFYLIGFIDVPRVGKWREIQINPKGGIIDMDRVAYLPLYFLRYLNFEAEYSGVQTVEAESHWNKVRSRPANP